MPEALFAFAPAIAPIAVTPGASSTFMATHVLNGERGIVRRVVAGTAAGLLSHAVLAGFGLSALVTQSDQAYRAVRIAGALYRIGLGAATIAERGGGPAIESPSPEPRLRTRTATSPSLRRSSTTPPSPRRTPWRSRPSTPRSRRCGSRPVRRPSARSASGRSLCLGGRSTRPAEPSPSPSASRRR